jgi:hypothetical protein
MYKGDDWSAGGVKVTERYCHPSFMGLKPVPKEKGFY